MNYDKELKLTHSKSKVKWWAIFAIFGIVLAFTACDKDNESVEKYPSLKVVNQSTDSWRYIYGVYLVGYEFNSLRIEPNGDSQTFVLDQGMPGGYEDIYVTVSYKRYPTVGASASITVDFQKGKTTTISLEGEGVLVLKGVQ